LEPGDPATPLDVSFQADDVIKIFECCSQLGEVQMAINTTLPIKPLWFLAE
jgi:hypothetical protein